MTGRLLTAREVSERLGVCVETVLVWVRSGRLRAIKLPSGQIRVSEAQLEAHLEEWATDATSSKVTRPLKSGPESPVAIGQKCYKAAILDSTPVHPESVT